MGPAKITGNCNYGAEAAGFVEVLEFGDGANGSRVRKAKLRPRRSMTPANSASEAEATRPPPA